MKIMFYSQHILGIGHFFRSMEIAAALREHEVVFVEGGEPLPGFSTPAHVRRIFLPPLMMDAEFKTMEVRNGSLEETRAARTGLFLQAFMDFGPQVLITELFPFGRRQFRFELIPVLKAIREHRMPTRVVCSLRDILVEKTRQAEYEQWVLDILNTWYSLLLIHSDPGVISLEETFSQVDKIAVPIHYTGFVVRPLPGVGRKRDQRVIVASSGGGKVGADLLAGVIQAVHSMPDRDLRLDVFIGPFMEEGDRDSLAERAQRDSRITLRPFSHDFPSELAAAELSISMAGYNTCMDILNTGVKALVYPFPQNREQALRARKLESLGIVKVLDALDGEELRGAIGEALSEGRSPLRRTELIDMNGAARTSQLIQEHFGRQQEATDPLVPAF
jgi:predicted glycosyltransferase